MTTARIVSYLVLAVLAVLLVLWGPAACNKYLAERTAHRIDKGQSEATLDSVDVANAVAGEVDRTAGELSAETKELANEVLSQPPGNSNAAAVSAVCGMRAYRDSERCAGVRAPDPSVAADTDTTR